MILILMLKYLHGTEKNQKKYSFNRWLEIKDMICYFQSAKIKL